MVDDKEVAHDLNISVKTVETFRHRIEDKINLRNIAELTKYAIRVVKGLLPFRDIPPHFRYPSEFIRIFEVCHQVFRSHKSGYS
jgi:hypothetical protein